MPQVNLSEEDMLTLQKCLNDGVEQKAAGSRRKRLSK